MWKNLRSVVAVRVGEDGAPSLSSSVGLVEDETPVEQCGDDELKLSDNVLVLRFLLPDKRHETGK